MAAPLRAPGTGKVGAYFSAAFFSRPGGDAKLAVVADLKEWLRRAENSIRDIAG